MPEDLNSLHAAVTGATSIGLTFFWFVMRRFVNKVDDTALALSKHEKEDIGKYATMDSLARVHKRIDDSVHTAEANFREMRQGIGEIKNLLINGARK